MDLTGCSAGMVLYSIEILCSYKMHHQSVHISEPTKISARVYKRHTHTSLLYRTLDTGLLYSTGRQ